MPFKANQDRRHYIPKQRHRVTNWAAYDIALRQRGSLTVWFSEAAIVAWKAAPRATRGGQPRYSALAITTSLTPRAVFRLALRQTEGLVASLLRLLGLDLAGIVKLSRGGIFCRRWRGGSGQRSPWHAYRAAPSQKRGAKKVDSTELS